MPTRIIGGYPCVNCGCWKVDRKVEYPYHWADFGVVLIEKATNYICESFKGILIQVIEHWEEKRD